MPDPAKYVNTNFYDIESLRNVFTLANLVTSPDGRDTVRIYYLCRKPEEEYGIDVLLGEENWQRKMAARIRERNPALVRDHPDLRIQFFDLRDHDGRNIQLLAKDFGVSTARYVNDPSSPSVYPSYFRPVCDTDDGKDGTVKYDPAVHPYLLGYNSYNYDTTMMAMFFSLALIPAQQTEDDMPPDPDIPLAPQDPDAPPVPVREPECFINLDITPDELRDFNNVLFESEHIDSMPNALGYKDNAWIIRKNMLMSGRHLDVARLNEKQRKVGLKRLLGMLGYQILESENLDSSADIIRTPEEFYELIAYNVSDIANLRLLFYHKQYQGQFELKKAMLNQYPELIYLQDEPRYAPDVRKSRVDKARLLIDSSSAQFATRMLCPYGHIKDIEAVSYLYPAKKKAEQLGIPQVNVLEEARKFFYQAYPGPRFEAIRAKFDVVYNYYKNVEGLNFNDSAAYREDYGNRPTVPYDIPRPPTPGIFTPQGPGSATLSLPSSPAQAEAVTPEQRAQPVYQMHELLPVTKLSEIQKAETCMDYYDADGNPTGCFALFSVGGIHGAEYNKALLDADVAAWQASQAALDEVKTLYPNPVDFRKAHPKGILLSDGVEHKTSEFLKGGRPIKDSEYKDLSGDMPVLFKPKGKGDTELNKRYVFTSAAHVNHEDFVSYYPNLLIQMMALYNPGLGYDRYEEVFGLKQKYGKLMKDKSLPESERENYRILREGTKLVLNSASGAAAALFENNIRANNQILSMRIIGQLFTWRIGQAQSMRGARVPSTNTDGLYSIMEATMNNAILEEEAKGIHVEIEPEPMYLISKDTNNRIELDVSGSEPKLLSASGGTLGCHGGPNPTKALAHPAIIDWALKEYLIKTALGPGLASEFDPALGRSILESAFTPEQFGRSAKALNMYQNVLASSAGSITYIFGMKSVLDNSKVPTDAELMDPASYDNQDDDACGLVPIVLQNYNRVFLIRPDAAPHLMEKSMHLYAAAARAITPAIQAKRRKLQQEDPTTALTETDPIAKAVLEANHAPTRFDTKDIIVKKVTGIDPEWHAVIENRDLSTMPQADVDELIDNLDLDLYLSLLDNAYTNNWKNTLPR